MNRRQQLRGACFLVALASMTGPADARYFAYSPDGQLYAHGYSIIRIREAGTNRFRHELSGHPAARGFSAHGGVAGLAFTPDGELLITAGGDGAIRAWDVESGRMELEITPPWFRVQGESRPGRRIIFRALAVSSDGRQVAVSLMDSTVHIWSLATWEHELELGTSTAEKKRVQRAEAGVESLVEESWVEEWSIPEPWSGGDDATSLAYSPDGSRLAAAYLDSTRVWDTVSGELVFETDAMNENWRDGGRVVWNRDATFLATGIYEGISMWDGQTGELLDRWTDDEKVFTPLAVSPDSKWLATGSGTRHVRIWDVATHRMVGSLSVEGPLDDLAFSPDGTTLVACVREYSPNRVQSPDVNFVVERRLGMVAVFWNFAGDQ